MNELTEKSEPMHWPFSFRAGCDVLCPGHASRKWGIWENGLNSAHDEEGNEVVAQYSWEPESWRCDICDPVLIGQGRCPQCESRLDLNDHYTWCSEYKVPEDEEDEEDAYEYGEF